MQQIDAGIEHAIVSNGILGVSRHIEHANFREQIADVRRQFAAIHAGHDDIGKQKIDRAPVAVDNLQRGGAVFSLENLVALSFQILAGESAEIGFIFDEQDGLLPMLGARKRDELPARRQRLRAHRRAENRRGKRCRAAAGCRQK